MESEDSFKSETVIIWQDIPREDWEKDVLAFVDSLFAYLKPVYYSLSVVFCSDTFIRELNKNYRDKDYATDVLSFPLRDFDNALSEPYEKIEGDIVISPLVVRRNAEEFSVPAWQELERVIVHGVLHLAGMDHMSNEPEEKMLVLQEKILSCIMEEFEF